MPFKQMAEMKLCAIIIVWDDWTLAECQIRHLYTNQMVDKCIVVFSDFSNYGELSRSKPHVNRISKDFDCIWEQYEPNKLLPPADNERNKRNYGLRMARACGYTHFIMTDADEFYEPEPFFKYRDQIYSEDLAGMVCKTQVYFKHPWLTVGLDTTLVPFIHKITSNLAFTWNKNYPFAWVNRQIRIDPTRQMNINDGVKFADDLIMHHYSYIRADLNKKIRNSTARTNLERSTIFQDFLKASEGTYCEFYGKTLERSSVTFEIPDIANESHRTQSLS